MKNLMIKSLCLTILILVVYSKAGPGLPKNDPNLKMMADFQLSKTQMDLIQGKGCTTGQWLATIGAWAGCFAVSSGGAILPILAACLGAAGGTIDCIDFDRPAFQLKP